MYVGVLLPIVKFVGDDAFAVPVREEVDRTGGYDAYECGSETFEQCTEGFFAVDIAMNTVLMSLVGR
jgi:hypothetical protein